MDIDLRKVRYFIAVAEELHFGRAAERLHIAQPALSRQVRALEDELNSQLFVRDRRHTELTAAGQQLLEDARPLLANADALRRRVGRAAARLEYLYGRLHARAPRHGRRAGAQCRPSGLDRRCPPYKLV